jgi:predicted nucleotidyltransferase
MILSELHNKRVIIAAIAKKYGAENVQVFGSVAREEETENSDIDILVSMQQGYDMFKQRIPLQEELMQLFGRKVDLLVRHELNRHLKAEILSNAMDI